jgi:hypothetical protein
LPKFTVISLLLNVLLPVVMFQTGVAAVKLPGETPKP